MVAYNRAFSCFERPSTSCTTGHRSSMFSLDYIEIDRASSHTWHNAQVFSAAPSVFLQGTPCKPCLLDLDPYAVHKDLLDLLLRHRNHIFQFSSEESFPLHNIHASYPSDSRHKGSHQYPIPPSVCACDPTPCCRQHSAHVPSCEIAMVINDCKG